MALFAQYAYGVVGSASSPSHVPHSSGSIFREELQDDPRHVIFDSGIPAGAGHKHKHSGSSSSGFPEAQGLLKNIDGGETSGPRFADDVMMTYDEQRRRYASGFSGATAASATDEEGRIIRRESRATSLSEYPPTPSSRNALLPPGAAPPVTPPAVTQAQEEHDLVRDSGMIGQRAASPPAPPSSPSPMGKSPQPLVPLNPD
jgi:hypothetical protein